MKLNVGTKNPGKLAAVLAGVKLYPDLFPEPEVVQIELDSGTFAHPKNINEIVECAVDRAKRAFINCSYSFGLESGLMAVPLSKTGFMEASFCAVYDGKDISLGLAPSFEWPREVTQLILSGEVDASKAFKLLGLTKHEKMGSVEGGIINFLTNGRLMREEQIKQSIIMALIQLEHPKLY